MQHYIFGYGSLMSQESRAHTIATPDATPSILRGFRRGWYYHDDEGYCALGIIRDATATCEGVLIPVEEEKLTHFDKREARYKRVDVTEQVHAPVAAEKQRGAATVWTYVVESIQHPTSYRPISQTYVDVVVAGCMEYGQQLARAFVEQTYEWSEYWINDRDAPIFTQKLEQAPHDAIDNHLKPHLLLRQEYQRNRPLPQ